MLPFYSACLAFCFWTSTADGGAPSFMSLSDLEGAPFSSTAYAVSADGLVVVGNGNSADGEEAFKWTESSGMVGMGDLPGGVFRSDAWAVSGDGSTIVGSSSSLESDPHFEACRWTASQGPMTLGTLPGGDHNSVARGVSADGSVIVGRATSANGIEAFIWTEQSGMVGLGDLAVGSSWSEANAVSGDGSTVVGAGLGGGAAFSWRQGIGMQGLGSLSPGDASAALAVNYDGSVIVGRSNNFDGQAEAFRWTESDGMVGLGMLPQTSYAQANAVSADGSVIVGHALGSIENVAFIWDSILGIQLLQDVLTIDYGIDLDGWRITEARGISADGTVIVGFGYNPDGNYEGWRVVIPEPTTVASLLLTIPFAFHRCRKKHSAKNAHGCPQTTWETSGYFLTL